jgi:high-affinity nickel permease
MGSFIFIIAVGFFLGTRHATDTDHVIAVTTIVTRQRQLTRAGPLCGGLKLQGAQD